MRDSVDRQARLEAKRAARQAAWAIQRDRLREAIDRAGTSPTTLARDLKIGHRTYFRDFLNGKKKSIDAAIMAKTAEHLRVDLEWLSGSDTMREFTIAPNFSRAPSVNEKFIPLLGLATGGHDGKLTFSGDILDRLPSPPQLEHVKDPYAVRIDGESMYPRYKPGETVYINPTRPPRRGDDVVVQIVSDSGEVAGYVKELVSLDDEKVVLTQFNPVKKLTFKRQQVRAVHVVVSADR